MLGQANAVGITLLADQGTGMFQGVKELDVYQSMRDSGRMTARFRYSVGQAMADRWDEIGLQWGEGDEWVRRTGWKIVSDGSNQGRTACSARTLSIKAKTPAHGLYRKGELDQAVENRLRQG